MSRFKAFSHRPKHLECYAAHAPYVRGARRAPCVASAGLLYGKGTPMVLQSLRELVGRRAGSRKGKAGRRPSQHPFARAWPAKHLGRAGEPAGVAGWAAALADGRLSPALVGQAFLASDEFAGRALP